MIRLRAALVHRKEALTEQLRFQEKEKGVKVKQLQARESISM